MMIATGFAIMRITATSKSCGPFLFQYRRAAMTGPRDVCCPALEGCSLRIAFEGNFQQREISEAIDGH